MTYESFAKWFIEMLLRSFPPNAVVIVNAPYHSVLANETTSAYTLKREMIDLRKGAKAMRKPDMYRLVQHLKPGERERENTQD